MLGGGEREGGWRDSGRERARTSGLLQSVRGFFFVLFFTHFVSCNGPCAPKENWHRKEHIIIITIIIFIIIIIIQRREIS